MYIVQVSRVVFVVKFVVQECWSTLLLSCVVFGKQKEQNSESLIIYYDDIQSAALLSVAEFDSQMSWIFPRSFPFVRSFKIPGE